MQLLLLHSLHAARLPRQQTAACLQNSTATHKCTTHRDQYMKQATAAAAAAAALFTHSSFATPADKRMPANHSTGTHRVHKTWKQAQQLAPAAALFTPQLISHASRQAHACRTSIKHVCWVRCSYDLHMHGGHASCILHYCGLSGLQPCMQCAQGLGSVPHTC